MTDPVAAWAAALDELEERDRRREAFLDGRGPRPVEDHPWQAPDVPAPAELAVRVRSATERSVTLEERVRALVARRPAAAASPYASGAT